MDDSGKETRRDLSSEIREPLLRRLYEYWLGLRGSRRMPARGDLDPLDIPYVLGRVMLVDVLRDPLRFRVRLHGTDMALRAGYDLTGRLLDDLPNPDFRGYVIGRCNGLVESGEPAVAHHDRAIDDRLWRYEALWLPFSDDQVNVTMLLCALIYQDHCL